MSAGFPPARDDGEGDGADGNRRVRSRVGVLTLHSCINYGSYWQARHLVDGLRALGCDAAILDHYSPRTTLAEWRCALDPVLPTPTHRSDRPSYRRKIAAFRAALAAVPRTEPFPLEAPAEMEPCDVVVVGSDEVWNFRHPWYGGCGIFFGDGVRAERLVAYAASFGSYGEWEGLAPPWSDRLRGFAALSVRDANSRRLLASAGRTDVELTLDPCLQFAPPGAPEAEPVVAVYGHNFSSAFARNVRRWATRNGCRVVSVGYRNEWAHEQRLEAGPDEFARCLTRAAAVATNFFHGCVFALRAQRPFVCELMPYRANKVLDLMRLIGGEGHLAGAETDAAAYDARLREPPADAVRERIARLRVAADDYLAAALA